MDDEGCNQKARVATAAKEHRALLLFLHGFSALNEGSSMGADDVDVLSRYGFDSGTPLIFLFTGEGSHSASTDVESLRMSPSWPAVEAALELSQLPGLDALLDTVLGSHGAPLSPVVTTVVNLLNAGRWLAAGHAPCMVIGHSIGEVAAAHFAGLLSIDAAVAVAVGLGKIGATLEGAMLHTKVSRRELLYMQASVTSSSPHTSAAELQARMGKWDEQPVCVAAINTSASATSNDVGVTLCGPTSRVAAWLECDPQAKRLPPLHPWHHPAYALRRDLLTELKALPEGDVRAVGDGAIAFVSATSARVVQLLDASYWFSWLSRPGACHARKLRPSRLCPLSRLHRTSARSPCRPSRGFSCCPPTLPRACSRDSQLRRCRRARRGASRR